MWGCSLGAITLPMAHSWGGFPNISPCPTYAGGIIMLATSLHTCSFSFGRTLVIIYRLFWLVWIFSSCNNLELITSWIQWYCTSMCLVREWRLEFLARWMALWLSQIDCTSLTYVPTLVRIFSSTRLLCKLQPLLCTRLMLLIMKCTSAALISMTLLPLQMSPSIPMWTSLSPYLQHKSVSI